MFGIINPPSVSNNANTSVASMMPAMMMNSSTISAMNASMAAGASSAAMSWGSAMDMSGMPAWSMQYFAENVMYTRSFLAMNPAVMQSDGSINLGASSNLVFPQDISATMSNSSSGASAPENAGSTPSASVSGSASPSMTMSASGATSTGVSSVLLGAVALVAAFLTL
ncbi:hypothetical protein AcW1_005914 [Taiwanofungus camphoratus]|nr:hypothetical protein AcV7_008842 [Antrodia cinnamomea]KAI0957561.1 hypothetical protein AcW1_005914 [Antrodia cinnamomea]